MDLLLFILNALHQKHFYKKMIRLKNKQLKPILKNLRLKDLAPEDKNLLRKLHYGCIKEKEILIKKINELRIDKIIKQYFILKKQY